VPYCCDSDLSTSLRQFEVHGLPMGFVYKLQKIAVLQSESLSKFIPLNGLWGWMRVSKPIPPQRLSRIQGNYKVVERFTME
jgi:hypothetical protein